MNKDDGDWIVRCEGEDRNVEICLRMKGDGERNYWMYITIPGMATTLKRVYVVGSGVLNHEHNHNLDEAATDLPANYDILENRFRLVSACDQLKGPFPSPCPYFTPAVSSAVLDSTVYCLGGDPEDIPDSCHKIIGYRGGHPTELPIGPRPYELKYCDAFIVEKILSRNIKPPDVGGGICHNIYTLNLLDPFSGWRKGEQPLISHRFTPVLVSYQGKLYAFSGNLPSEAFAEVYDPVSHAWTQLPPPPFGWLPDTCFSVVPLKPWNKLWVVSIRSTYHHHHHPHPHPRVDYTFDVITGLWEKRTDRPVVLPPSAKHCHLTSALSPHNHMVVYWIDQQVIYAYNLSTCQLFEGSLSTEPPCMNLHHLHHDFFFLIRCDHPLNTDRTVKSVLHVTLVQISNIQTSTKSPHRNSLKASVLACFAYPFAEHINITDSYLMSDGI